MLNNQVFNLSPNITYKLKTIVSTIITFNSTSSLAHRLIAHTRDCSLELSRTYSSFLEFISEFNSVPEAEDNGCRIDAVLPYTHPV